MKNVFEATAYEEVKSRVNKLTATSVAKWGKMNVAQMLAHCGQPLKVADGSLPAKRTLIGILFGKIAKKQFLKEGAEFKKGLPTDKDFIIKDERDFEKEKQNFLSIIDNFYTKGESGIAIKKHPFFGNMTPKEWGELTYMHLNHHLNQFGA